MRAGVIAQLVNCFVSKGEDLSSIPGTNVKKKKKRQTQAPWHTIQALEGGGRRSSILGLVSQMVRLYVQREIMSEKLRWGMIEEPNIDFWPPEGCSNTRACTRPRGPYTNRCTNSLKMVCCQVMCTQSLPLSLSPSFSPISFPSKGKRMRD